MSFTFPPNKTSEEAFTTMVPIITPEDLKDIYLFGIKLQDQDGNQMPRKTLEHAINSAISYLEATLDIVILKRTFKERYDYKQVDYTTFNFLQLKKRPLSKVHMLKAKFPNNVDLVEYPKEWYVEEKEASQIQLSPVEGTFSGLVVTSGSSYVPLLYGTKGYWPHLFEVEYEAGFCHDAIPNIINDMIGMQASIRIFEIMGDLIHGPGINAETVTLDGASVNKGTTASATNSPFAARIKSYKDQMKEYIDTVKGYFNGIPFTVV